MKKLSLFFLLFVSVLCYANDIIITKQSEKIEATIVEVTKSEIKYRKSNNPTGPIFVLGVEDISSIIYSNGEVEAFAAKAPVNNTQSYVAPNQSNYQSNMVANNGSLITRISDNLYSYEGKTMTSKELGNFFQFNCQEAYAQWKKGKVWQDYGITWAVLGPVFCLPVGLTLYACSASYSYYGGYYIDEAMYYSGIFFMTFGAGMTVASIPFLAIGTRDKNNAYITYNNTCANKRPNMSLNFQVNTDGVGLALKF